MYQGSDEIYCVSFPIIPPSIKTQAGLTGGSFWNQMSRCPGSDELACWKHQQLVSPLPLLLHWTALRMNLSGELTLPRPLQAILFSWELNHKVFSHISSEDDQFWLKVHNGAPVQYSQGNHRKNIKMIGQSHSKALQHIMVLPQLDQIGCMSSLTQRRE